MGLKWQDLPERKNVFTTRNATMRDLNNGKIIQHYSANTRITVVQKCVTKDNTYYRTRYAVEQGLDWAFEASAFGLPNEAAPLANSPVIPLKEKTPAPKTHATKGPIKTKSSPKKTLPKSGGEAPKRSFLARLLSRFKK